MPARTPPTKTPENKPAPVYREDAVDLVDAGLDPMTGMFRGRARAARTGVFEYLNVDGTTRREFVCDDELFDAGSMGSLAMRPVTLGHPREPVTADNGGYYAVGATGDSVMHAGDFLEVPMLVHDARAIQAMRDGAVQLSCGYLCDLDVTPGVWNGQTYDAVQRGRRYNHLAIVQEGRQGSDVRVRVDGREAVMRVERPAPQQETTMAKLKIDGVEYEIADGVANVVQAKLGELEVTRKDAAELKTKLSTVEAERDAAKAEAAKRTDAADLAKVKAEVRARVQLEEQAGKVLGAEVKLDGQTDDQVRRAVCAKLMPDLKLDGKDEAYVRARFDIALEDEGRRAKNMSELRRDVVDTARVDEQEDAWTKSRRAYLSDQI